MNQISTITLPRVTKGWLARARVDLEKNPVSLGIQRDEHTEKFRPKYKVEAGIGFWADNIELFVEKITDPFGGILMFREVGPIQVTFEWLPRPDAKVVRFCHFTFGPGYPDAVEEVHQYHTEFETCWGDPTTVRYRREWELSTRGNTSLYGYRYSFLKLLRSNDRYRRLQESGAPQVLLEAEAQLLASSLEQLYEVCPLLPHTDAFPISDELLYQMLRAAWYSEATIKEIWQLKDQHANVWSDSVSVAKAWWECNLNSEKGEARFAYSALEGDQRALREMFLRSEFGVGSGTLYYFLAQGYKDPEHPVGRFITGLVKEATRKLTSYTKRKRQMAKELAEFLAWLEKA